MNQTPWELASSPAHYHALGLSPANVEPWENGMRTSPSERGTWEWWYFDANLSNGAKLVVAFLTKDPANPSAGLNPRIVIRLDLPDGRNWDVQRIFAPHEFMASKEACDVRMSSGDGQKANVFRGDELLGTYDISAQVDDLDVEISLKGVTKPWRPKTGHMVYGEAEKDFFGWLVPVPYGTVKATYRVRDEKPVTAEGSGYHDHNWGNISLAKAINHWYWGRGKVGPYTVISSTLFAERPYTNKEFVFFMLSRDGALIADDGTKAICTIGDTKFDSQTRRPVADVLQFEYLDHETKYTLEYVKEKILVRRQLVDSLSGIRWVLAKLIGFDGCQLGFSGRLKLRKYEGGELVEEYESEAMWDLAWFGKVHE